MGFCKHVVAYVNSLVLLVTEKIRVNACVMRYSKFDQEVTAFVKVLAERSLMRT